MGQSVALKKKKEKMDSTYRKLLLSFGHFLNFYLLLFYFLVICQATQYLPKSLGWVRIFWGDFLVTFYNKVTTLPNNEKYIKSIY